MSAGYDQDKTEPATAKKREDARKKGQVASSREIPSVLILTSSLAIFFFAGDWILNRLALLMRDIFQRMSQWSAGIESATTLGWHLFAQTMTILLPLMMIIIIAGVGGHLLQNGFYISSEALQPKFSKLNPISGIKRLVSLRSLVELVKSIIKVAIIGTVSYTLLMKEIDQIPALTQMNVAGILAFFGHISLKIGFYTCLVLVLMAGLDFLFQRWQHERDLRMSKQEVKDEHKQREGDPAVKGRIRAVQREMAMRRMMQAVPDATVVITNPTHLAVALKFDDQMAAPVVLAKGAGLIAARIREIASDHGIPVIEQKPLARALFKDVELGQSIPAALYKAVAEVLAYVYRLKGLV